MAIKTFVGTSGYNYPHWSDGVFYPRGLPERKWLEYYMSFFNTVELNVSFYRLPKKSVFEGWRKRTPENFRFVVKGSRFITHIKKLKDCEEPLKIFFNNVEGLKKKLGAVLWQLPPNLHANREKLEAFCKIIHGLRVSGSTRHSFEFRHSSWFCEEIYAILRKYGFSLCIAHSKDWPCEELATSDFIYFRFHGGEILYGSNYSEEELREWASKAKHWMEKRKDIYAYFNNDAHGFAVKNALRFKELLER
jgi:uncharacterized protein YecE (DUF72 family)